MARRRWLTQQLAEFLAAVSSLEDEASAVECATERAAEAVEAEVAAFLRDGHVVSAVGFGSGRVPEQALRDVVADKAGTVDVPGAGRCPALASPLEDMPGTWLVAARSGEEFTPEDASLLRGMGRVLALTLRMLRVLEEERTLRRQSERQAEENERLLVSLQARQALLERLSRIERSIAHRAPVQSVLDAVTEGAAELLGDEFALLRVVDRGMRSATSLDSATRLGPASGDPLRCSLVEELTARAMAEGPIMLSGTTATATSVDDEGRPEPPPPAMVAPVYREGVACGALLVASRDPRRRYSEPELEVLVSFAEHASLALTDASTVDALRDAFARASYDATHDALTGLPNRTLLMDRLEQALHRVGRGRTLLAVLFVDLDRFKLVNDRFGHRAGDSVLMSTASRLRSVLRPEDTIARFGGDEFVVLCEGLTHEKQALELGGRILEATGQPVLVDGVEFFLGASVGISFARGPETSAEVLLRDADFAMYQAKERGRNRYEVFDNGMRAELVDRIEKGDALRRALEQRELVIFYQPQIDLVTQQMTGVEALVRWQHPGRGILAPHEFIPLAEETGLIGSLGSFVLAEACRQVAAWDDEGRLPSLTLAVNLSARQLTHAQLIDDVQGALVATGLSPARLSLEITESVLMEDVESSLEALLGLKALGIRVAIDDFGTGYSSLSYLRRFPIDVVKVDRSFVAGLGTDAASDAIVAAVVKLSRALGHSVVAEGVETEQQLVALRALGCDRAQGYYWSRPLPAGQLPSWRHEPAPKSTASADVRAILVQLADVLRTSTDRPILVDVPSGLPAAAADAGAVRAVVEHLVSNAVNYSAPGRPVILTAASDRRWVRVTVADYGMGMTAEEARRCFEQFWQADLPEGLRSGGTGIGLYIVRSLVEGMGGHVGVRSARGRGSSFTFALPRSASTVRHHPGDGQQGWRRAVHGAGVHAPDRGPGEEVGMTLAVTLVNMVLGLAYTGYGVLTAVELKRDWRTFGFSHFGTAWLFMAFTCGPHHLSHGLHLLEDGSGGVLDLVSVLVGLPVGLTWLWLRIEAFSARGRGDRFIPGTPAWLRPVPLLGAAYTVALTVACVDVVRSSRPAGPIARANLVLVVIYLAIAWFLLRTQLQHRRQMGGWSLSGLSLGTVFATCALMHLVWASYAVAGWYRADVHSAVIDALSIPAGTYFLWVVRKLYRNALKDWNDQLPPTEPVPMQAGVYVSTERRLR